MLATFTRRRRLGATLVTLALAIAIALGGLLAAADDAHAIRNPNQVLPSHKGWVEVKVRTCNLTLIPGGSCDGPTPAWRWYSGYGWWNVGLGDGHPVYAWPYTGTDPNTSWHWVWTQRTGWLAMRTRDLDTGYSCTGTACPMF